MTYFRSHTIPVETGVMVQAEDDIFYFSTPFLLSWLLLLWLQNLDALHDHLATIYPGMRAPSFRCTVRPEDGALILHYYSDRPGLEHIVIGIVKVRNTLCHIEWKERQLNSSFYIISAFMQENHILFHLSLYQPHARKQHLTFTHSHN